jgi:hypothetical protein
LTNGPGTENGSGHNMDAGKRNAAGKRLCFIQGNSPFDVENKKTKAFNPLSILKGNSTCMAYWEKLQ